MALLLLGGGATLLAGEKIFYLAGKIVGVPV
jgi:hypothetical protein